MKTLRALEKIKIWLYFYILRRKMFTVIDYVYGDYPCKIEGYWDQKGVAHFTRVTFFENCVALKKEVADEH